MMQEIEEDIHIGIAGATTTEDILVYDNVTCISKDLDDPFWLMLVDKTCHVLAATFTDNWRNTLEAGDVYIRGY
jgi:hypothetical protein